MNRITQPGPQGTWVIPEGREMEAAQRLAAFETARQRLTERQWELAGRMEELKAQGKQKTAQFREAFGEKLTIQNLLQLWETYGVR
ncbi:MAG TPA: hypothetical protein IAC25_05630 [Candidatus Enterenecus stercoripullorum]|nr:hypothetical protein [Candidatus Enterenecus stercoripullorum]